MSIVLWPYEETRFQFPDDETARVSAPWRARDYFLTTKDKFEFEQLVLRRDEVPPAQQRAHFSRLFGDRPHDPFFYVLARPELRSQPGETTAAPEADPTERFLRNQGPNLPAEIGRRLSAREWNVDRHLFHARLPGTDLIDPLSLLTILRRYHLVDALRFDESALLRDDLAGIKNAWLSKSAADFVAERQDAFHRRKARLLEIAFVADAAERARLLESLEPDAPARALPLANHLIDVFKWAGRESAIALAAGLTWIDDEAVPRAFSIAADHPPIAAARAHRATFLAETISRVLNHLSANLRFEVGRLTSKAS